MDKLKLLKDIFGETDGDLAKYLPFVDAAISTLDEREQYVLQKRYSGMTLRETGKQLLRFGDAGARAPRYGVSQSRVREIQNKAIRKLRHPSRKQILRGHWTARTPFKDESIDLLELSARAKHAMRYLQITSVGDLILKTEKDILNIKNVGRKTLNEIKEELLLMDLSLRRE